MSKMTRAWVEAQIEQELERGNRPEAVRDLAALIEVHKYMMECEEAEARHATAEATPLHMRDHNIVNVRDYQDKRTMHDPALDTAPTMDQVERAMGALSVNTEADKKRMHDLMTWGKILKGDD